MPLGRAALAFACLAFAALLPFAPGCGGKVGVVGSGSSSGAGSSSGDVSSSSGIGSSSSSDSSSSGIGSSSGVGSSASSGSIGSSTSSSGGTDSSSGGSSGGTSASSSGGVPIDAGPYSCTNPAPSVPSSEIPPFMGVWQQPGACSGSDIAGFIDACDSAGATAPACNSWFSTASRSCVSCLQGGVDDADIPNHGGLWYDWQGNIIGANAPGCDLLIDQNSNCAVPYNAAVQCLIAAGCGSCTSQAESQMCQQVIFGSGGACANDLQPAENACMTDFADGGTLNNGPCGSDTQILSVICGNGSGDGG